MTSLRMPCGWWLLLVFAVAAPRFALAADSAAEVLEIRGTVTATALNGEVRTLSKGAFVFPGDRVETAARSRVRLEFTDRSQLSLGPGSSMQIDSYSYKPAEEDNDLYAKMIKGAFRFVTGLIAKSRPERVKVETPVATIGIRGTNFAGEVEESAARIILLEPEEGDAPGAIQVSNEFGSVVIDQAGFGTEIPDKHSPPSPPRRMTLRTINNLMRTLQSLGRIRPTVP